VNAPALAIEADDWADLAETVEDVISWYIVADLERTVDGAADRLADTLMAAFADWLADAGASAQHKERGIS